MRKVSATELQRNTREVIDQVRVNREPVVIENRGKPMAVMLPYEQYEAFLRYRNQRDEDFERIYAAAKANAAASGYPSEEEAMEIANQVLREVRAELRQQASA